MFKQTAVFAVALIVALGVLSLGAKKTAPVAGSWVVDPRHSDAGIMTDGTTDYGKTKIDITLGVGRIEGELRLDDADLSKSHVDLHIYPATGMTPSIGEEGTFKKRWLASVSKNMANETLLCFHSKEVARTADGKLQAKGELSVVRVDRNIQLNPGQDYYGPVYGDPVIHRVAREATFVLDIPAAGSGEKNGEIAASASTKVFKEDFPQLVKTVVSTYWPPVVQDENCRVPAPSEAYYGARCTGTFVQSPSLPPAPQTTSAEDIGASPDFNSVVGERVNIALHMRLLPKGAERAAAGY
jgi:polyisoprenoid-binding protein YceI